MADARDPFLILGLGHDAEPEAVRRAFRRLAQSTHPDRGGSAEAFHETRLAYGALTDDLEGERRRWRPVPAASTSRFAGGLDPKTYPTCPIVVTSERGETRTAYDVSARPEAWVPTEVPPPGGTCSAHAVATPQSPAFGVWTVPLDANRFRCVFGPPPTG